MRKPTRTDLQSQFCWNANETSGIKVNFTAKQEGVDVSVTQTGASLGTPMDATGKSARTAWLPTEFRIPQRYGRPPGQIGAIYDTRTLIPPGTGYGSWRPSPK